MLPAYLHVSPSQTLTSFPSRVDIHRFYHVIAIIEIHLILDLLKVKVVQDANVRWEHVARALTECPGAGWQRRDLLRRHVVHFVHDMDTARPAEAFAPG